MDGSPTDHAVRGVTRGGVANAPPTDRHASRAPLGNLRLSSALAPQRLGAFDPLTRRLPAAGAPTEDAGTASRSALSIPLRAPAHRESWPLEPLSLSSSPPHGFDSQIRPGPPADPVQLLQRLQRVVAGDADRVQPGRSVPNFSRLRPEREVSASSQGRCRIRPRRAERERVSGRAGVD